MRKNPYWEILAPEANGKLAVESDAFSRDMPMINGSNASFHWYHASPIWNTHEREISDDVVILIFAGKMLLTINDAQYEIGAGELIYLPQHTVYHAENPLEESMDQLVIHLSVRAYQNLPLAKLIDVHGVIQTPVLVEQMALECWKHFYKRTLSNEALANFLCLAWRNLLAAYHHDGKLSFLEGRVQELQRFLPAIALMTEALEQSHPIDVLAQACALSEPHFRRVFHRAFGMSPVQYRQMLRLNEAARLLEQGDETLEQIAERIGYQEVSFFSRTFKQHRGMSPGQYRKLSRANLA